LQPLDWWNQVLVKKYQREDRTVWDEFVKAKTSLFFFQRDFMDYHQDRFEDYSLLIYNNKDLVAVLPASLKESVLSCHGGLTFGYLIGASERYSVYADIWQVVKKHCIENNIRELIYKKPPAFLSRNGDGDVYELLRLGAVAVKTDLTSYVDYTDYAYSKGRKSSVAKSLKQNLVLQFDSSKFAEFYDILSEVLKRNHQTKPVHTLADLKLLNSLFPQNVVLCVVVHENNIVAGAMLFIFDNVVHTQYLSVTESGKSLCAMDFLLHSVIEKTNQNLSGLSFGISTEDGGKIINTGLILQKESYGAKNYLVNTYKIDWLSSND
jgi:Acetyltransferase (GNAT) domain